MANHIGIISILSALFQVVAYSQTASAADLDVFDFTAFGESSAIVFTTPDGNGLVVIDIGPSVDASNVGRLGFFDTATNTYLGEYVPDVGFPVGVEFTADSSIAYLSMSKAGGTLTTSGSNRIEVLDLSTRTMIDSIPIAGSAYGPSAIALSPNGSKLYSLHRGDGRIDVIDTQTNTVTNQVPVSTGAVDIDFSPDNMRAYISGRGNPVQVVVVDVASDTVSTSLTPGLNATQSSVRSAVAPDLALYVASNTDSNLKVIDINAASPTFHDVVATVTTTAANIRGLSVNPILQELYLAAADSGDVVTIDVNPSSPTYRQQIDALALPERPAWIAYQSFVVADLYVSIGGEVTGYFTVGGPLSDFDIDSVLNGNDNCSGDANVLQTDTNSDGFGNACDTDLDDDCMTNFTDLGLLKEAFFSMPGAGNWNPDADFNASDSVNFADLGIMKQRFFLFPGPSGITDICDEQAR